MKTSILFGAVAMSLAACGGGGGGDSTPTQQQLGDLQGYWSGPVTASAVAPSTPAPAMTTQAIVLNDGSAWLVLLADGAPTGLVKATLSVAGTGYTGTGKIYDIASDTPAAPTTVTLSGSATAGGTLGTALTASGAFSASTANLTYSAAYRTPAALADTTGTWTTSASLGAQVITWAVSNGSVGGTSTTGCTWSGAFTARTPATAVLDYTATETCAGTPTVYSGIGVFNNAKTTITLFVVTDGDQGKLLQMAKAP